MKLFYHRATGGNVGDELNAVLWRRLLPDLDSLSSADHLIGIGTILDGRIAVLEGSKVVMGSGLRPGAGTRLLQGSFGSIRVAALRGHLSADALGLPHESAVCDPGFLVGKLWPTPPQKRRAVAFIPHVYSEHYSQLSAAVADAGLQVISPALSPDEFIARLSGCARVFCESLHAAIFADALRIPWVRVRACSHYYEGSAVADFKWRDAFSVLGTSAEPLQVSALLPGKRSWPILTRALRPLQAGAERHLARALARRADDASLFRLSDPGRIEECCERLLLRVEGLRRPAEVRRWPEIRTSPPPSRRLRVLMFPKEGGNAYLGRLSATLERHGVSVDEFDFLRAFFGHYDVVHLHWPDTHLRTHVAWRALAKHARLGLLCLVLRARGIGVVWMLHNLRAHEQDHWISSFLFPRWFPQLCSHVVALTPRGLEAGLQLYPALRDKPSAVVPHGHYRGAYPQAGSRTRCREQLGLAQDKFTFLFFGSIRRYKNVPALIERFRALDGSDVQLLVAGLPVLGMRGDDLRALAGDDPRIHLQLRFIPDEEVGRFVGAADLVVLPFENVQNSGSAMLALSLDRPVCAPAVGALPELQAKVGARWMSLYEGPLTTQILQRARTAHQRRREAERPDLSAFEWDAIGAGLIALYQSPAGRNAPLVAGGRP